MWRISCPTRRTRPTGRPTTHEKGGGVSGVRGPNLDLRSPLQADPNEDKRRGGVCSDGVTVT
jgi:hypothetical protein